MSTNERGQQRERDRIERLVAQVERASLQLPQVTELPLTVIDRIARSMNRLERWLLDEVETRERVAHEAERDARRNRRIVGG